VVCQTIIYWLDLHTGVLTYKKVNGGRVIQCANNSYRGFLVLLLVN
jgi:hypothetical protein